MTTGARHGGTALRSLLIMAVALCLSLALAGCSVDSSDASKPKPSSSSSPSWSASSKTASRASEKVPAAPKAARGTAGQKKFARHVMDLWGYGLRTNDAKPLVSLGPGKKPCVGCTAFAQELTKRRKQGWSVDFSGLKVVSVKVTKEGVATVARAKVDIPASDSYNSDGSYRNSNKAHPRGGFEVRMRYAKKGYSLLSFTVS